MAIKSVTPIALNLPFEIGGPKPLFAGKPRNMEILLVRVETNSGLVGWGEAFGFAVWPATRAALENLIAPLATGRDERDIPALLSDLQRKLHLLGRTGPVMYAMSGLDIALWDIAGKAAGKPLADLLGGARRTDFVAYASLVRYGDPALVARNARAAVERGYRAIKLHEIGAEQVKAARNAIGPDVKLMMDTNCPWTAAEAIEIAAQVREYDLFWFEEPVWPPEDYPGLARVRRECGIAVSAGENAVSYTDFQAMFDAGAVDYAQPSVTKIGGVTEMMRIAGLARDRGVNLVPHSPYFGPGLLATLHMAAVFEHEAMIEYSFADLGANPLGDAIAVKGGRIALPPGPGLGRDPDPENSSALPGAMIGGPLMAAAIVAWACLSAANAATVAIDVGHYREEPGATSARGRPELEFNRDLAEEIKSGLDALGHRTRLIGAAGDVRELWRRPRAAKGADFFISVHHDSTQARFQSAWTFEGSEQRYSDRFAGFSLFVSRENRTWRPALKCASAIGAALVKAGFKPSLYHADPVVGENRPFADKANGVHFFDRLAVLRRAGMPAVLFEAGVIVNRDEELQMRDAEVRKRIAASVVHGIGECLTRGSQQ